MATKANLIIDQGATFSTSINLTDDEDNPVDLTNYTGAAQLRKHYTSSTYTSFVVTLGGNTGTVLLSLTANATANLTAGRYVYDCEVTANTGVISRVVEGIITVNPQVTR